MCRDFGGLRKDPSKGVHQFGSGPPIHDKYICDGSFKYLSVILKICVLVRVDCNILLPLFSFSSAYRSLVVKCGENRELSCQKMACCDVKQTVSVIVHRL